MSASPTVPAAVPSQKRPLEDPASDSGIGDQPEAKRPALGNSNRDDSNTDNQDLIGSTMTASQSGENDDQDNAKNGSEADAQVADAGAPSLPPSHSVLETQPIQSTSSATGAGQNGFSNQHQDETGWLYVRAIISSAEAATIIGKGGENVQLIRRMSGAKCTVSDYAKGAVERILTVSGLVDAVAKAFGLIIRTLNNEPLEAPSSAQSKTYPLRLLIPHILIGSIIGQKGMRIREIQEASGARLNASESCLPLSTERSLVVLGVADAVHIATYYVGSTLVEQLTERFGGPAASAYAARGGGPAGVAPGGMQVVPYTPQAAGGQWGQPDAYRRHPTQQSQLQRGPGSAYGGSHAHGGQSQYQGGMQYGAGSPRPSHGYGGPGPHAQQQPYGGQHAPQQVAHGTPQQAIGGATGAPVANQPMTQQIFIPNDMVGAIIGKGGAKINEIRQLSGSVIKINEPQDNSNERLVTITGAPDCNQMALYMLYQRLGEAQKQHNHG